MTKAYRRGTHRACPPEQTLECARPLLPAMGITRIADITGLDRVGIPTVLVCRPNSRSVAVALGKGADLAEAKASGVMEAVETFHAESIDLPLRWAARADLAAGHRLADVDRLPLIGSAGLAEDRPILSLEEGKLVLVERVIGETTRVDRTVELVAEEFGDTEPLTGAVTHAGVRGQAAAARMGELLGGEAGRVDIAFSLPLGPVLCAHTGFDVCGIAVYPTRLSAGGR